MSYAKLSPKGECEIQIAAYVAAAAAAAAAAAVNPTDIKVLLANRLNTFLIKSN